MKLSGDFVIHADREAVFEYLVDPAFVTDHLPDVELVGVDDDRSFRVQARVGVSNIRGVFDAKCELTAVDQPNSAHYSIKGIGISSRIALDVGFELTNGSDDATTTVMWVGDAIVAGRLASIGTGLIEPIVQHNTQEFVAAIQRGIELAEHGEVISAPAEVVPASFGPGGLTPERAKQLGILVAALLGLILLIRALRRKD